MKIVIAFSRNSLNLKPFVSKYKLIITRKNRFEVNKKDDYE
ncbi:MAG: hypothetical protein QW076_03485 [Candidatus Anstonellales archaeon]